MSEREYVVAFLGDPEYGREDFERVNPRDTALVTASSEQEAAKKALAEWRRVDAHGVKEEGWYGPGTIIGVQLVTPSPPVRTFVTDRRNVPRRESSEVGR